MTFGLTTSGFVQKRYTDIISSLQASEEAAFGANILDQVSSSVISQLNGVFANEMASVWQLGQDVYSNSYPSTAGGTNLALLGLLTGISPLQATQSWTVEVFIGTNTTLVPSGSLVATTGTLAVFQTLSSATIVTVPAWVPTTAYTGGSGTSVSTAVVGQLVSNDTGKIYYCIQSGTSNGSGGPTGTGSSITDGTCKWAYVATASAAVATLVQAQSFGPIPAAANNLTILQSTIGGVASVTNPLGATNGTLAETDAAFRVRRVQQVRSAGNATVAAIQAKILQTAGVLNCVIVNNPTPLTVNGQPANSFAPYIVGGASQDIFNTIVKAQPAGIQSYGTITGNGTDVLGNSQPAGYSVAPTVNIYVAITLTSGANYSGAASVKNAVAAFGNSYWGAVFGGNIIANLLYNSAYFGFGAAFPVTGVTEISSLFIGTSPSPGSAADIPIASTSVASFNSANITVNGV